MRRRMVSGTGFGNSSPEILDNSGKLNKKFARSALLHYFLKEEGFDFKAHKDYVSVGIEPTYQYDLLKIITIDRVKKNSSIRLGKSWGPYGSQITATTRTYGEYVNNCKFTRFVDRWHPILFGKKK